MERFVEDGPPSAGRTSRAGSGGGRADSTPSSTGGKPAQPEGDECVTLADCPQLKASCAYATCSAGTCVVAHSVRGTFVARNSPADCHDVVCDGMGSEVSQVDLDNAPESKDGCMTTSCSEQGEVVHTPVKTGGDCSTSGTGKVCDGAGKCVRCASGADCDAGESCSAGQCISGLCSDGSKNDPETDVDCGGDCPPCKVHQDCGVDADCASGACDAYAPRRCLADHCADHHRNGDESDADCGGSCDKCAGGTCNVDSDCVSDVCDKPRGSICLSPQCVNGKLDGTETDLDCGGGICDGCAIGQKCFASYDCATFACNAATRTCQLDHCTDGVWDADESYIDCGGSDCPNCQVGQRCVDNADCADPHVCSRSNPHVCE
jgi:hypothetical protein